MRTRETVEVFYFRGRAGEWCARVGSGEAAFVIRERSHSELEAAVRSVLRESLGGEAAEGAAA